MAATEILRFPSLHNLEENENPHCHNFSDPTIFFDTTTMAITRRNATISPDRAADDPGDPITDTVPMSDGAKRRNEEADTSNGTGTRPAAKVARLANTEEETKAQENDEAPVTSLTTGQMMDLIKDLWSDDKCVIKRALTQIADLGFRVAWSQENEVKMRELGGHVAVFQVLQKHVGCLVIQMQGLCALANLCHLVPTMKLLGDIGCVEVILARMQTYPDCERIQLLGCVSIRKLVRTKDNAKRFEQSGGIAVVIAAMKAHSNSEIVQDHGCKALSKMSKCWEEYRPLIVKAGGASAVASIIEKYWDHLELRKLAYNTMDQLFKKPL